MLYIYNNATRTLQYVCVLCVADAGETPGATASPQQGGKFRRTFSFRRRERQESSSVSSPGPGAKEQAPKKVTLCSYDNNTPRIIMHTPRTCADTHTHTHTHTHMHMHVCTCVCATRHIRTTQVCTLEILMSS